MTKKNLEWTKKFIKSLKVIKNANTNNVNSHIRTLIGLKSIRSSIPYNEGSRFVTLENSHKPFGLTSLYAISSLNYLTVHICSSEFDEDIAILNKQTKAKINTTIKKKLPSNYVYTAWNKNYIRKGELIASGPNELDEIKAPISGKLKAFRSEVVIENTTPIGNGTKIQNIFLQKHILKTAFDRYRFLDTDKESVCNSTIENLKEVELQPQIVNLYKYNIDKPTIVTGSNSLFKRRASGHFAQLWLGLGLAFNLHNSKTENKWDKTVYVTKVLDTKTNQKHDAIVGIPCWLVAITSGGYEYNIASLETDFIGRHKNSVSIDPFAYKVLKYKNKEIANAILKYQLETRKENLKEYLNKLN